MNVAVIRLIKPQATRPKMNDTSAAISIGFTKRQRRFLTSALVEVSGGGSTKVIQATLGTELEAVERLEKKIGDQPHSTVSLSSSEWRTLYHSINAVVYGLGPFELDTCTGMRLADVCNINLAICSAVWGVYYGAQWNGEHPCCDRT